MWEFERLGGISFIILSYTARDEIFYLPLAEVEAFWKRMEDGGRKSFTYDEVDKRFRVRGCRDMLVHYLEQIQMDLDGREEADGSKND